MKLKRPNLVSWTFVVEQLALVPPLPTHHRPVLRRRSHQLTKSPFGTTLNAFIDSITQSGLTVLEYIAGAKPLAGRAPQRSTWAATASVRRLRGDPCDLQPQQAHCRRRGLDWRGKAARCGLFERMNMFSANVC